MLAYWYPIYDSKEIICWLYALYTMSYELWKHDWSLQYCNDQSCLHIFLSRSNIRSFIYSLVVDVVVSMNSRFVTKFKGWDTLCDKFLRHAAATGCCNKLPRVTCENHCCCKRVLSLRSVARIQSSLNSFDISQRQNKRKQAQAALLQKQCRVDDLSKSVSASKVDRLFDGVDAQGVFVIIL